MAGQEAAYWYLLTGEEWPLDRCIPITTMVPICEGDAVDITLRSDVAVHDVRVRVREIAHQQIVDKEGPIDAGCHIVCSVEVHHAHDPGKCCDSHRDIAVTEYFLGPGPQREPPPRPPRGPSLRLVE